MNVKLLTADLEADGASAGSKFVEIAVIFDPENQLLNGSAGAFGC